MQVQRDLRADRQPVDAGEVDHRAAPVRTAARGWYDDTARRGSTTVPLTTSHAWARTSPSTLATPELERGLAGVAPASRTPAPGADRCPRTASAAGRAGRRACAARPSGGAGPHPPRRRTRRSRRRRAGCRAPGPAGGGSWSAGPPRRRRPRRVRRTGPGTSARRTRGSLTRRRVTAPAPRSPARRCGAAPRSPSSARPRARRSGAAPRRPAPRRPRTRPSVRANSRVAAPA